MKTTLYLRIFIVLVTMTAIACSESDIAPTNKGGSTQFQPSEFYTNVATWTPIGGGTFIGLVSTQPYIDLSTVAVFVVSRGERIPIDRQPDASKMLEDQAMFDGYFYASIHNDVLQLNYVGKTAASKPPFPLEVILEY
jgi:hypothetical protein